MGCDLELLELELQILRDETGRVRQGQGHADPDTMVENYGSRGRRVQDTRGGGCSVYQYRHYALLIRTAGRSVYLYAISIGAHTAACVSVSVRCVRRAHGTGLPLPEPALPYSPLNRGPGRGSRARRAVEAARAGGGWGLGKDPTLGIAIILNIERTI